MAKDKEGNTIGYDYTIIKPVTPTAATRALMESTSVGKWMDSKASGSSLGDFNNKSASNGMDFDFFDGIDNE
ncbi:hypothetical protein [Spirosoma knui]